MRFFASTAKNLEPLLLEELKTFGVKSAKATHLGVAFEGDVETAYRACLWSRLAHHIFLELKRFEAADRQALYQAIQTIDWSTHFRETQTFRIDVSGRHPTLTHPHFMAQIAKDAIVDQFRKRTGTRPSIQSERPDIVIQLHVRENAWVLYLDFAGESLHRRGLRTETGVAPIKETLATALLIRSGWPEILKKEDAIILDPCCGAGTLLIEAAMMAYDIAPGLFRDYFSFLTWRGHQPHTWKTLIADAKLRHQKNLQERNLPIIGFDINARTLASASENFRKLNLTHQVHLEKRDVSHLDSPLVEGKKGLIITNPPYGKRLMQGETQGIEALYAALGKSIKAKLEGWKLGIFTQDTTPVKAVRMRPKKQYQFLNGMLECSLITFEVKPEHYWVDKHQNVSTAPECSNSV